MKKLLLVFAVMAFGFAASAQKIATVSQASIFEGKTSGTYVLQLPDQTTVAEVDAAKAYYTGYFTVAYAPGTHLATITLTENAAMNRKVITRFLMALQLETVKVDGKTCPVGEFYETFLK